MSDFWVFGTYFSLNSNIDRDHTPERRKAKWRSQVPLVNPDPDPIANFNEFYKLNFQEIYIVAISEFDYITRNTDPIGDSYRILRRFGGVRVDRDNWIGTEAHEEFAIPFINFQPPIGSPNVNPDPFPKPDPFAKQYVNLDYLVFTEDRLELGIDYGAVGGLSFDTKITEVADDREQRNINRDLPLGRWQLGDRTVSNSTGCKTDLDEIQYLKNFFDARLGCYQGFRFKDWADYKVRGEILGITDGIKTQYQMRKGYTIGNVTCYRPIQKPVVSTVSLYIDGVLEPLGSSENWNIDTTTGVFTSVNPEAAGKTITADCDFDVPVWFENDEIGFKLEGYNPVSEDSIYRLESVSVVEGRIPLTLPWDIQPLPTIAESLDLGIIFETIEKYQHSTNKIPLKSGYTKREAKREDSRLYFDLGSRNYCQSEVDLIQAYFYCSKGRALEFPMRNLNKNYKVRFNQDNLNWRFEAVQLANPDPDILVPISESEDPCCDKTEDAIFNLNSIKVQAVENDGFLNSIDFDTYVYILIDTSGSLNSSIPSINEAIDQLEILLTERVYSNATAAQEKFIRVNFSDERWLATTDIYYQEKAIYLMWINEAAPTYHTQDIYTPPTSDYQTDLANFLANYSQRTTIKMVVYSVIFDSPAFPTFQAHLNSAFNGTEGYQTALKDYNLSARLNIPETSTAEQYYNDFLGIEILGDAL